ncbi:iron chaperone [Vulgatibacter incomptus]|uniref:DUF1801 domain-containing protein n=1 Tax=Vulgatibacter incomptus TaxID=1391653 RepID=A0A0K1PCD0_9BACT|nr:DUF1801 domain-containing protein [Vulgatibacter incomptus]AKU90759.1 DUF1801 domain-containing protein [Vulgatibacter incomptus]
MASSRATTVEEYLAELPSDRRAAIETVRRVILDNLPSGFEEGMQYGMPTYYVPLSVHPDTYNGQPLMVAALASQKGYMAVYLMTIYARPELRSWFETAYRATGKRFDAGKSCVRFRTLDDLPLELVGEAIAKVDLETFVAVFEESRKAVRAKPAAEGKKAASTGKATAAAAKKAPSTAKKAASKAKA